MPIDCLVELLEQQIRLLSRAIATPGERQVHCGIEMRQCAEVKFSLRDREHRRRWRQANPAAGDRNVDLFVGAVDDLCDQWIHAMSPQLKRHRVNAISDIVPGKPYQRLVREFGEVGSASDSQAMVGVNREDVGFAVYQAGRDLR